MENIKVNFKNANGKIKYMNAVNNGPTAPSVRLTKTNFDAYKAAGISYARNHDASFYTGYGGEHTVDVHRIFKNFDADENAPESYIFKPTDEYLKNIEAAGTKVFYRLGASIEHGFKYGTYPPKDTEKWVRICEHIIDHYTNGWADGYKMDIEYWEIWNEPDCFNADGSNPCWQGTEEEFVEFFCTALKLLKEKYPGLKIGGPAFMSIWSQGIVEKLMSALKERNIPIDFISFHWYGDDMTKLSMTLDKAKEVLDKFGFNNTELILNEWNYVRGWSGDEWEYTIKSEKGLKGASFVASAMAVSQAGGLDMLMYYDARPCAMNGMFDSDTFKPLKGYYPFVMFKKLLELGTYVTAEHNENNIYSCAATDGENHAIMLSYFNDDDNAEAKEVRLDFSGLSQGLWEIKYHLLDEAHNSAVVRSEKVNSDSFSLYLNMTLYSTYLIEIDRCKQ